MVLEQALCMTIGLQQLAKAINECLFEVLLCLGLIATAFTFIPGQNTMMEIKMVIAVIFATALIAIGLHRHALKPFPNPWLMAFVAFVPISIYLAPNPVFKFAGVDVNYFWAWEPFLQILLFALLAITLASYEFSTNNLRFILKLMMWCGALTGGYMLLQFFYIDQFFLPIDKYINGRGNMSGFIGNPTLSAPFVAMIVPLALYFRQFVLVFVMAAAVVLSDSQMAYGSLLVTCLFYMATKGKVGRINYLALAAFLTIISAGLILTNMDKVHDNQRFQMWKIAMADVNTELTKGEIDKKYPFTGRGAGSFRYAFHSEHPGTEREPNGFLQAHNEYVETTYQFGYIGLLLLLAAMVYVCWHRILILSRLNRALIASFICIAVNASGTFVWQIGTTVFYTVVVVGFLHNKNIGDWK